MFHFADSDSQQQAKPYMPSGKINMAKKHLPVKSAVALNQTMKHGSMFNQDDGESMFNRCIRTVLLKVFNMQNKIKKGIWFPQEEKSQLGTKAEKRRKGQRSVSSLLLFLLPGVLWGRCSGDKRNVNSPVLWNNNTLRWQADSW